jgi:hypothetical protein
MAKMPSTLGDRAIPRATRRAASFDPSGGLALTRRGSAALGDGYDDLGRGLQVASNALYEEQLKDEERAVKNLEVEWSKKRREILFGDGTPNKPGFFSTSGEDTLNSRKSVEEELSKARAGILGKASSPRVKQAFDLSSNAALQGELEQVDRYTITQRKAANLATSKAAIEEAVQQASTYFSDDGKWDAAVTRIANEMASMGDEQGWSQEVINTETQKVISQAASDRVKRALLTDAAAGETIYSKTRGMIDGDMRIEIEQDIKAAKNAERIQREHDAAMARLAKAEASENAALGYINRLLDEGTVNTKELAQDSRLNMADKLTLARLIEANANDDKISTGVSQRNTAELFRRMNLPVGDPNRLTDLMDINKAFATMQVNRTDFNFLVSAFSTNRDIDGQRLNKSLSDFLTNMKGSITKSTLLGNDPAGDRRYYEFMQDVYTKVTTARSNNEDPEAYITPGNPKYLGNPENLQRYKGTFEDRLLEMKSELSSPNKVRGNLGGAKRDYKTKEEVVKDYNDGKLDYDAAAKILVDKGWATAE